MRNIRNSSGIAPIILDFNEKMSEFKYLKCRSKDAETAFLKKKAEALLKVKACITTSHHSDMFNNALKNFKDCHKEFCESDYFKTLEL